MTLLFLDLFNDLFSSSMFGDPISALLYGALLGVGGVCAIVVSGFLLLGICYLVIGVSVAVSVTVVIVSGVVWRIVSWLFKAAWNARQKSVWD